MTSMTNAVAAAAIGTLPLVVKDEQKQKKDSSVTAVANVAQNSFQVVANAAKPQVEYGDLMAQFKKALAVSEQIANQLAAAPSSLERENLSREKDDQSTILAQLQARIQTALQNMEAEFRAQHK